MTKKARSRDCQTCGASFVEAYGDSNAQWEKRQFCSIKCNNASSHRVTSIFDRLERYQIKREGCWGWSGGDDGFGYGTLSSRDKKNSDSPEKAHRISYEKAFGPIPDGMQVCHRCDNPPCTNPDHLFLGTAKDNADDCSRKGRNNPISLLNLRPGAQGFHGAGPISTGDRNGSWS